MLNRSLCNQRLKSKKESIKLYYLFFILLTIISSFNITSDRIEYQIVLGIALVFWLYDISFNKYLLSEVAKIGVLFFLCILSYLNGGTETYIFIFLVIAGAKNISLDKLLRMVLKVKIICISIMIIFSIMGVTNNLVYSMNKNGRIVVAQSFGYGSGNTFSAQIVSIIVLILWSNYKKINWKYWMLLSILAYINLHLSASRTGFYISIIMILCTIFTKYIENSEKELRILSVMKWSIVILAVISIIISIIYVPMNFSWESLNKIFTGRLSSMYSYVHKIPITLFGSSTKVFYYNKEMILDNMYIYVLLRGGVILFVIMIIAYFKLTTLLLENKMIAEYVMICTIPLIAFSESFMLNPVFNPYILYLSYLMFDTELLMKNHDNESKPITDLSQMINEKGVCNGERIQAKDSDGSQLLSDIRRRRHSC